MTFDKANDMKLLLATTLFALTLCLQGCGTIASRSEYRYPEAWPVYPGTHYDLTGIKMCFSGTAMGTDPSCGQKIAMYTLVPICLLADLPLSTLLDTLLLPYDISHPNRQIEDSSAPQRRTQ